MEERSRWVDVAKALGIILVVYGHVARGLMSAQHGVVDDTMLTVDAVIYSFHMPLFFFLSGLYFLGSLAHRGLSGTIRSKVATVLYPYVVWSLLQGLVEWLMSEHTNGHVSLAEVFSLAWHPRAQFWFLYALFFIFLLSTFIYSAPSVRRRSLSNEAVFGLTIVLYLGRDYLGPNRVLGMLTTNLVFFSAGVLASAHMSWLYRNRLSLTFVGAVLFAVFQTFYIVVLGLHAEKYFELFLALVSLVLVVGVSMIIGSISPRWFLVIGSSSMSIYLLHILVGSGIRILLTKVAGVHSLEIHLVVGTACGVLVSFVIAKLLRKYGFSFLFSPR